MNSIVKPLYELIKQSLACQERLQPYKMTQRQITEVFVWLDYRRRGFIDVSDFYNKFSDLNESQLFFVFKYLDISRKGSFNQEDLQVLLCTRASAMRDPEDDSIRSFTNLVKILRASFHLIQQQKRKLAITTELIQKIFEKATFGKKEKMDMTDLIVLFKEAQLQVNQKMLTYIRIKIFIKVTLSMNEFVQIFSQFIWDQGSHRQIPNSRPEFRYTLSQASGASFQKTKTLERVKSTDNVNSEIDRILLKYKTPNMEELNIPELKQRNIEALQLESHIGERLPTKSKIQKNWNQGRVQGYNDRQTQQYVRRHTDLSNKKIQNLFGSTSPGNFTQTEINKRRQELRRGSLERQKIIDDVMNRKKHQGLINKPGMVYTHNLKLNSRQQRPEQRSDLVNLRPSTPSSKINQQRVNIDHALNQRFYQNFTHEPEIYSRPSSANKTASHGFFDKSSMKLQNYYVTKPDMSQFMRKAQTPKNFTFQKENILKRAEQEATRKIEQIERRARLKVMQKRTTAGIYNRWMK